MTVLELVPAKGLPRCAAISPGVKGRGLRCPRPPWEIEAIGSFDSASRHQLRFYLGHAGRVPLPMRRARGALGRAAKMAAFPVSAARALPVGGLKDEV